ncbi:hypothetical protein [Myroides guanonis]|uniref:Lipoprotein n=1 Tax=Myroides guanonis TaxID=1150112 RepID=A0A1I3PGJ9_9FLAO|nr:hypothetical protein [Myroides guanonis]SFJ20136.1 hypothetical protein SAMN04487893_104101 [Myroides guanonis]
MRYFFVFFMIVLFVSCSRDNGDETIFNSNQIQRELGKEESLIDFMNIDRLDKDSSIAQNLLNNINYPTEDLDLDNIKKATYGWTNFLVFEIPFKINPDKRLSVFNINNDYLTTITELNTIDDNLISVMVTSTDEEVLYRFDMQNGERFANFEDVNFGYQLQRFIYSNFNEIIEIEGYKYPAMDNCGKYSFSVCMECGYEVCDQDWRCRVASSVSGPLFAAGLAITCGISQIF